MQKKRTPLFKSMRFITFQFLLMAITFSMAIANGSNAQEILNRRISVNLDNVELKEAISQIENKAKVNFTYSPKKIAINQKVTLKVANETLKNVCEQLFFPININYKLYNDSNIVLTYDPSTKKFGSSNDFNAPPPCRGKVTDETGEPLIGASVLEKGTTNGTTTDIDGNFSFDVPEGATLIISYTGYASQEVVVGNDGIVNVVLKGGVILEELTVTGSRGKPRTDLDSPVPIDAIQATELIKTGQVEIAQAIHFTVPSFSAQKFGINDLAPLIDPAQLRGLGSDQTLLLVNGKRRHKVAFFNGNDGVGKGQLGNDINSIPSAAVERVEILRDGAAAQYGSDAIAGVVNLQLKKNRSGGSIQSYIGSTLTKPEFDDITNKGTPGERIFGDDFVTDGNAFSTSLNFGLPWGEKGFISTTLSYSYAEATDRSGTYSHSSGWFIPEQFEPLGLTDEELQVQNGIDPDRAVLGTAENTNGGVFINAGREINDTWDVYALAGFTKKQIIGGVFTRTPARTDRAVIDIFFDGYNPEVPSLLTDWQALSGIKGKLKDDWTVDFSVGFSGNDVQLFARNTVNPSLGADSPTQFYTGGLRVTQSILNLDVTKNLTDNVNLAVGSEFRRETFEQFEGERESWFPGELSTEGRDIGSSGREGFTPASTGFWDRNNIGIYAEIEADLTEEFLVTVAGRFEDYSDFGSDFSYKAAARYKINSDFAIRGSVNRSFRAPALAQTHYSNFSQISFDGADGASIVSPTLPVRDSRVESAFGIENLTPETSFDYALGATAKLFNGDLKLTLDAYQINVDDRIFIASVDASDFPEFNTSGFDDINFFTNAINTSTQGLDFVALYKKRFSDSSILGLSLAVNFNETEIDDLNLTPELEPFIAFERTDNGSDFFIYLVEGTPTRKIIFSPSYSKGWFTALARMFNEELGEWDDNPPGGGEPQILSSKTLVDLSLTAAVTENFSVTVGANNLFDVYPDLLREAQVRNEVLYSRRVNQFGTNGRFVNLTLNYNWK